MSAVRIDPKRFEDAEFTVEYFRSTGFDPNEMNRQLIADQVQVNLLVVLATTLREIDKLKNEASGQPSPVLSDVDSINKAREANQKATENAPVNSTIQTAESVSTNPANLGTTSQDATLTKSDVSNNSGTEGSGTETPATSASDIDL
jgi:hypothetical protein